LNLNVGPKLACTRGSGANKGIWAMVVLHDSSWISTASALPVDGQPVEFMLGARECPIVGVYSQDGFRSRWTHYAAELVYKWRGAAENAGMAAYQAH
jgi:hypothetical protein